MVAARQIMGRIKALGNISEEAACLTRTFASPAMRRANDIVADWMRQAGMKTRSDALGNLIGRYPASKPGAKTLLLGSHLDTVRNAGKFDGPLGVVLAIQCVDWLNRQNLKLPFHLEVIAFADEEGVRYQTTYLGSKAVAGCLASHDLKRKDANGIAMSEAIRQFGGNPANLKSARMNPRQLLGYVEAHIEQGPVLEQKNLAVGIVTGIAGQSRARVTFLGRAGHAGTVPMTLRKDALCAAAEFVLAVEALARKTPGLVATIGEITAKPGASNVIPSEVHLTLDVRHARNTVRRHARKQLRATARKIASRRNLALTFEEVQEAAAIECSPTLSKVLAHSVKRHQKSVLYLASGAGHDTVMMAQITPVAMLFVSCKGGISHHPDESVKPNDIQVAYDVLNDFILRLADGYE